MAKGSDTRGGHHQYRSLLLFLCCLSILCTRLLACAYVRACRLLQDPGDVVCDDHLRGCGTTGAISSEQEKHKVDETTRTLLSYCVGSIRYVRTRDARPPTKIWQKAHAHPHTRTFHRVKIPTSFLRVVSCSVTHTPLCCACHLPYHINVLCVSCHVSCDLYSP